MPTSEQSHCLPILNYGQAELLRRRVMRRIPRVGKWTVGAVAVAALCGVWLVNRHGRV